jgi:hypothetical protein
MKLNDILREDDVEGLEAENPKLLKKCKELFDVYCNFNLPEYLDGEIEGGWPERAFYDPKTKDLYIHYYYTLASGNVIVWCVIHDNNKQVEVLSIRDGLRAPGFRQISDLHDEPEKLEKSNKKPRFVNKMSEADILNLIDQKNMIDVADLYL